MRRIVAQLAISADGFIARPDGDVGWLDRPEPKGGYGLAAFYRTVDTVILGRKTYDIGRKLGQQVFEGKKNYVFSRRMKRSPHPEIELLKGDVGAIGAKLRRQRGKNIWLIGGAQLVGEFLDAGQLDELIFHVIPTLIGQGIPLLSPARREVALKLTGTKRYPDGVVRLSYEVQRPRAQRKPGPPKKAASQEKGRRQKG